MSQISWFFQISIFFNKRYIPTLYHCVVVICCVSKLWKKDAINHIFILLQEDFIIWYIELAFKFLFEIKLFAYLQKHRILRCRPPFSCDMLTYWLINTDILIFNQTTSITNFITNLFILFVTICFFCQNEIF